MLKRAFSKAINKISNFKQPKKELFINQNEKYYPPQHPKTLRGDLNPRQFGLKYGRPTQLLSPAGEVPIEVINTQLQQFTKRRLAGQPILVPNQRFLKAMFVGPANSGKSTLLNALTGFSSTASRKRFTTFQNREGIYNFEYKLNSKLCNIQACLIDTPGVYLKDRRMLSCKGWEAITQCALVFLTVDGCKRFGQQLKQTARYLENKKQLKPDMKTVLVVNKADTLIDPLRMQQLVRQLQAQCRFQTTVLVSALYKSGLEQISQLLARFSSEVGWLYGQNSRRTGSEEQVLVDLLYEAIFQRLHRQVPYTLLVELSGHAFNTEGVLKLEYTIKTKNESTKAMFIGYRASNLKYFADHVRIHFAKEGKLVDISFRVLIQKQDVRKYNEVTKEYYADNFQREQQLAIKQQLQQNMLTKNRRFF